MKKLNGYVLDRLGTLCRDNSLACAVCTNRLARMVDVRILTQARTLRVPLVAILLSNYVDDVTG
jgi:hypothetical protein